ncbi:MAG: hypothetical protein JRI25_28550, partial [Deltaproteobacteria bacterium]|nr:hypothetical protein [Deltaproteobacteria bacterium]
MLAGRMKLKTFITLVAGVVLVFGLLCLGVTEATPVMTPVERVAPVPSVTPVAAPATPATPDAATPAVATPPAIPVDDARPFDALLLERAGTDLGSPKLKDITKG